MLTLHLLVANAALHLSMVNGIQQPSAENGPRAAIYAVHPLLPVVPLVVLPGCCAIML